MEYDFIILFYFTLKNSWVDIGIHVKDPRAHTSIQNLAYTCENQVFV